MNLQHYTVFNLSVDKWIDLIKSPNRTGPSQNFSKEKNQKTCPDLLVLPWLELDSSILTLMRSQNPQGYSAASLTRRGVTARCLGLGDLESHSLKWASEG
uniref:Uncharacterized protein n=1 Tax=Opuntia streptacantha TaxID=393608 RepID=A0A7C9EPZ7_OPUST